MERMKYPIGDKKIDIGGTKGNVFLLTSILRDVVSRLYTPDAGVELYEYVMFIDGETKFAEAVGGGDEYDYEDVLRRCVETTGVQFVSERRLSISSELYKIERNAYL